MAENAIQTFPLRRKDTPMTNYLAAAIQMDTQSDVTMNLKAAASLIGEAAAHGAKLAVLPETMNYLGRDFAVNAEPVPGGTTFHTLAELAKKYRMWLVGGSIYEWNPEDTARPLNTAFMISPEGKFVAKYSKLHPFDVVLPSGVTSRESDQVKPGERIVTAQAGKVGTLGFAVCYDIRFGEMFRLMALQGAQLFAIPANFTEGTGRMHWEVLLRARAVENECYVIAANQVGKKPRFTAYGHSMIIDPRGKILAEADGKTPGVIYAPIDLDLVTKVRQETFTLANRREDVYRLTVVNKA
jgi:predicted amidohydrolase